MAVRKRERHTAIHTGYYTNPYYPGVKFSATTAPLEEEFCTDVIKDFGGQHILQIRKQKLIPFGLSGTIDNRAYSDFPVDCGRAHAIVPSGAAWNPEVDYHMSVNEAIAESSPANPPVEMGAFLYELRELPSMLRETASRLEAWKSLRKLNPKQGSKDYLAWQFGWRPLIDDLLKCSGAAKSIANRARALHSIGQQGFASQRIQRGTSEYRSTRNVYQGFCSKPNVSSCVTSVGKSKAWIVARWGLVPGLPLESLRKPKAHQLIEAATGLDSSFTMFWEAMPWSWLVDWCTDLSSIAKVHSNRGGFKLLSATAMQEVEYSETHQATANPYGISGMVEKSVSTKSRSVPSVTLSSAQFNVLSEGQLGTLGAIYTSRQRGLSFSRSL